MSRATEQAAGTRRMVVITTPELIAGYRLAGVATLAAASGSEASVRVRELVDDAGERGIIAIHEPFLADLDPALRRRLDDSTAPLLVALPSGEAEAGESARRDRLLRTLWRAIGYHIGFPGGEPG